MSNTNTSFPAFQQRRVCSTTAALAMWMLLGMGEAWAGGLLYRCAGKPEVYTNQSWAANRAGCRPISGGLLLPHSGATAPKGLGRVTTVALAPHTRHMVRAAPMARGPVSVAADLADQRVAPMVQSVRDQDRKRILEEELGQEQARLAALGDSIKRKHTTAPATELALLSQSSARVESNVQALQRELLRLRP
jgi:hypothetical protein